MRCACSVCPPTGGCLVIGGVITIVSEAGGGNPTQDSDGNMDSMKDKSIVEAIMEPISNGKLKTAMDIGTIDNNVKNMHVYHHTKKDGVLLPNHTTYVSILHGSTKKTNVADKLPEKKEKVDKVTI
eukprot:scaffold188676_cov58-Attheya_sp.AAC.1